MSITRGHEYLSFRSGHRPVGVEGPEVVDADGVVHAGAPLDALLPEGKDRRPVALPVVERIAPELAVGGEGVGGDPGHRSQAAVLIQLKQLRVVVHLGAVGGTESAFSISNEGEGALDANRIFERFYQGAYGGVCKRRGQFL